MRNDTMRGKHALIPLLNPERVLGSESELHATVEYASGIDGGRAHVRHCGELDRARNRKYVGVFDDWYLPKADARLRNRVGRNEADVDLPRVEHFEHFARRRFLNVDLQAERAAAHQ